nr:hypothetical protein CFP56_09301 [Quercus suber]
MSCSSSIQAADRFAILQSNNNPNIRRKACGAVQFRICNASRFDKTVDVSTVQSYESSHRVCRAVSE